MLGQPAAAVEPGDRTLADPALGQDGEARQAFGTLDDPGLEPGQDDGQRIVKDRPVIGAPRVRATRGPRAGSGEDMAQPRTEQSARTEASTSGAPSRSWTSAGVTSPRSSRPWVSRRGRGACCP